MTEQTTLERAYRLIRAATGEDYGDGSLVTDVGVGIAEPGYGNADTVWALGNWNTKRYVRVGDPALTAAERLPERLAAALERYDVETLWLDEWIMCENCYRIFRTEPDCYQWQQYGHIDLHGQPICADCITFDDIEDDAINNASYCIRNTFGIDPEDHGFIQYNGRYQNGWHHDMTDLPTEILEATRQEWAETVFVLSATSQFYVDFTAYVRYPLADGEDTL